jgi:hypothetical protein
MSPEANDTPRARRHLRIGLAPLAVALALSGLLAACGNGDDDTGSTTSTSSETATSATDKADSSDTADTAGDDEAEAVDNETADAELLAATTCDTFGESFQQAAKDATASDDAAARTTALADIDTALTTALGDLATVTLPGEAETMFTEMIDSMRNLSTEIDNATGDEELTRQFFTEQPTGVAVAMENISARADELGLSGCMIDLTAPAS